MEVRIRPIQEGDVGEADRIVRLAFGTFLNVPDPMSVFGDSDFAHTRYRAAPDCAFVAEADDRLVGSNFVTQWGSFGFFGPLSIEPRMWNQGIAQKLLEPTVALLEKWNCTHAGLFTFSHSPQHAALYQKFGFWSRFLTPIMSREVRNNQAQEPCVRFSELRPEQKTGMTAACRDATTAIYDGLDVTREIEAVDSQRLGDTLVQLDDSQVRSFAVCHVGANTEAGSGACYVKFGCARPGGSAQSDFEKLLKLCEAFAASRGASRLVAGVNMGRHEAYRTMLALGFRTDMLGVAMHRPNEPGFSKPGVYIIDDWR